ncbi:putative 37S ribosomal protein rsm22 protein [Rosellinia necatrix]|uniref:Putative 37S ribosomal protein rsm22 protein n=1 Tax=Rosellinia necatrix TaxID=77044 RepID=A0A1W2TIN8_ROSNE|nr:putative 37S ribosomal protein rsm22 protein [Rosellinia necatrix]
MLSAARAQRSCPQCRRQILSLFAKTFTHVQYQVPGPARCRPALRPTVTSLRISSRCFSATKTRLQAPGPVPELEPELEPKQKQESELGTQSRTPDDIEKIVRQARHAFGDTLPSGYLSDEEYKLYLRLYGPPLRETQPEDVGMPIPPNADEIDSFYDPLEEQGELLLPEAEVEETSSSSSLTPPSAEAAEAATDLALGNIRLEDLPSEAGLTYINAVAKNSREFNALLKLQKDFEAASLRPPEEDTEENEPQEKEEEWKEEVDEEDEGEPGATFVHPADRVHEFSSLGHWRTHPSTLQLPKSNFVNPITKLLDRTDIKHVREAAEKAFGGAGLPFSVSTPPSKRNAEQRAIPMAANHHKMSEIEADTFIATLLPAMYSSTMSILVETRKRLGPDWMAGLMARGNGDGPRVLDVGTGGAGLAAWERVLQAEWDLAHERGKEKGFLGPPCKKTVVVGSEHLRQRVSRFLHNTTFLPRLPDYLHSGDHPDKLDGSESSLPRKQFDVIIASHQMLPAKEGFRRKALLDNLWEMLSPQGGVLIVVEKGHPRGFEAVADVRARLLDEFIVSPASDPRPEPIEPIESETRRPREPGMIVAPCTNHKTCPMYRAPGLTPGRKDFCHFSQRFIRPPFLQKILGATHRNHEDVDFSFIAVQRGTLPGMEAITVPAQGREAADEAFRGYENSSRAPNSLSLPRNILPPIKRQGHVTLDLCTPAGTLERWTVPKSFSKKAYRDARKAQWGDLWALGAKTRVVRPVRLGKGGAVPNDGGVRAQQALKAGKARVITLGADASGIFRASESTKTAAPKRRTKGGKKGARPDLMKELDLTE